MELFLNSQDAKQRVRAGDADPPSVPGIVPPVNVAQATPAPKSFEDFGFTLAINPTGRSVPAVDQSTQQPSSPRFEDFGFTVATQPVTAPAPAPKQAPVKQEEEGFFTGLGKSLLGGTQDTAGSLYSAGSTVVGANNAVVESAQAAKDRQKTEAQALSAFKQDIGRRQQEDDSGLWAGIKNVAGATYDNPEGAFQMVVSQLPNTAVSLGSGYAGAQAGAIAGTAILPGYGTAIGGVAGFLTGLFAANTALEIGGKAQEKARDGSFTDQERSEALTEGGKKGAVITAVDAVTLGASKWLLGAANRAVETATVRSLQNAGIDTTKAAASIKDAQKVALEATASQGREASTAAIEKATYEAMVREGMTDPAVMASVRQAQKAAMDSVNTLGKKIGRGTAAVGLETAGEGLGEYLGELAATGKASPTEAVMEALSGLSMSLGELHGLAKIEKPGTFTAATNIPTPGGTGKTNTSGNQVFTGNPDVDGLIQNVTELDDFKAQRTKDYFQRALERNRDSTLNVMAAMYAQEKQSDPKATAQNNETIRVIEEASTRLGVYDSLMNRLGDFKTPSQYELAGEQILSDFPQFRNSFFKSMQDMADTLPANTSPKFDNRKNPAPNRSLTEEEVMNMAPPDEGSSSGEPANSALDSNLEAVRTAENPGQAAAQIISSTALSNDTNAIKGWTENSRDRYNVVSFESPDGTQKAFTHPELPGVVFKTRNDLFNAFKLLDTAAEARKQQIAAKANPETQATPEEGAPDINPDLLYSKEKSGRVKAAFFKDLKKVYYSKFAWRSVDKNGIADPRKFRALELHEIGAHYALERMIGSEAYHKLLSDMSKLKGKDKMITEAYDSVPSDTIPELVDHEALGYLIENYENNSFVQRLFQMFKDWYAKTFNNQELTASDLRSMVKSAFQMYNKEITRVYLKENINATPKAGTKRVDFQGALNETPDAHKFLDFMEQFNDKVSLSGSLAISAQKPIFRPAGVQVHDLDFRVQNKEDLPAIMEAVAKEYPNSAVAIQFASKKTNSDVVSLTLDKDNPKSLTVDFFTSLDGGKYENLSEPVKHTYKGEDGKDKTVFLNTADDIFGKKLAMNRAKDVNDAIQAGGFDVAFSKEKPTVSDLITALPKVIKDIIETGESKKFEDMQVLLRRRMMQNEKWKGLVNKLTPAMVKQAYNKVTGEMVQADENERTGTYKRIEQNDFPNNKVTLHGTSPYLAKDQAKANKATKFIGRGSESSSTAQYAKDFGKKANTGLYTDKDKVFVSAEGNRPGRIDPDFDEIGKAVSAGATIITDNETNRNRAFNIGERQVADFLTKNGYAESKPGEWTRFFKLNRTEIEQKKADLVAQIKDIYKQNTNGAFYQNLLKGIHNQIDGLERRIKNLNYLNIQNEDGSVSTYYRQQEQEPGMERQLESTGRMSSGNEYFETNNEATFDNPDSKPALLARKRMLELELKMAQEDKLSKQAQLGKLGIRVIRRQIDDAIQAAVKNGLPVEESIDIGREWIGGIDNYLQLGKISKAEKQAKAAQEMQDFMDQMNASAQEAEMPSDYEFSLGINRDIRLGKIDINKAIDIVDEASRRNELENKKKTVSNILTELVSDYGIFSKEKEAEIAAEKMLSNILNWASKAKKEGLLRFDDFVDIFHSNNLDVPHEVVKMGEVAATRGLLDYMADNKFDPAFRYYWLRSMDRVVQFNPSALDSRQFTDLERDLYSEWKEQTGAISNRRKEAYEKQVFDNLLFNRYSIDQMRNPSSLPINERMRLQQLHPDLVDAYFGDMWFAFRNGYVGDALANLSQADRDQFNAWLDRKNKMETDSANRLERQKYFAALSQFKHIGEDDFQALYQMMARDSIANLPMIIDMAQKMEEYAIKGESINPETGEITKLESESARKLRKQLEEIKAKSGKAQVTAAQEENEDTAFEENVMSAFVRSQMGDKGVADSSIKRDPLFDFNMYKDVVEGRLTSYEEGSGEQNTANMEDESVADQMMSGMDVSMTDEESDTDTGDEGEDNARLRQGQYVGFLSTGMVMNYVRQITKSWTNAPNIVVLQNHLQLPEGIREEVSRKLQNGMGAKGLFDGSSGTLYLFSNYISSLDDAQFTLFHEAYGHLGLRLMFGKDFDVFLENMYNSSPAVKLDADARMGKGIGKLEAIEETLSDFAGENKETGVVKEFIGKIIAGLRKIGLDRVANYLGGFTDAELSYSLKAARSYAQNAGGISPLVGGPIDIRLSEERPPYEIFAKKGMNTTGYARYDPLTGQYYVFEALAGKNDIRQGNKMLVMDSMDDVVAHLDKLGKLERRVRSGFYRDDKLPADFVKFLNSRQVGNFRKALDYVIRATQNQYLPVFRIVEQMEKLGRITGDLDLRKYLRTTERQTAVMVEDFNRNYVTPIMDLLAEAEKAGGSYTEGAKNIYEMLNKFLLAQTAEERNRQVNKRNPTEVAGSGMASASSVATDPAAHPVDIAQKILDFVATQPYAAQFESIGKKLDAMSDAKMKWEVKSGLLSQKEADARQGAYQHYRNLSGINTDLDEDYSNDPSLNIGRKFNVRGKDKFALGRGDEAPDILARTLLGAEGSIIRGNKNLVAQRVLAFFETNYDPNFVSINEQAMVKQVGSDGFAQTVEKQGYYNQPDVMVAKVRGVPVTIRFKDSGYTSIAEAIHGKSDPQSEHPFRHVMQLLGRMTGALITKYNPFWIPVNFVRDVQTLFLNAGVNEDYGWKMSGQMAKALIPAMGTALRVALMDMHVTTDAGKAAKAALIKMMGKPNAEMMAHYQEGRRAGAFTSFINHKNLEDQIIQINEAINGKSAIGKVEGFFKFWELVTLPVEMAPRLAAYSTLKNNGHSTIDAADYAGSVTVDFNMRGANEWLRAAYLFFNPAVQGTAQLVKLAKENPKRFGAVAGGLMTLGFLTSVMGRMQGDDDDEKRRRKESGLSVLDEIPDYKRATSVILFPNTRGGAIPIAYGWNAFFAAGVFAADSVVGNVPASLSFKRTVQAAFEAFSPVGGSGFDFTKVFSDPATQALALVMPTAGAPISQWQTNKNRWGGPLYPDSQFSGHKGESDVTKAFDSVNPISRWLAENLQAATGGNRFNKEGIDINPALIDHLSQSYLPGLISEVYKGAGVAVRKAKGLDVAREKEPLFDRFSAYPSESFDAAAFRRVAEAVDGVYNKLEKTPSNDPRRAQILKLHPEIGQMKNTIKVVEQELREIHADVREAEETAYILRQAGEIERANKMDADAVTLRNKTKVYEKQLLNKVVAQAAKSGFSREVYSD